MSYQSVLTETTERYEKSLKHLQEMLRGIRTGRASSALVDNLRVDYYGTPTPLSQIAAISIPEPRSLMIKPFDGSVLKEIEKAILKSDMGASPQNDGKVVRISLPPLSGEQRKKYAAKAKEYGEEARVAMRNGRRELNKQADAMQKSGELTEDENKKLHDEIQEQLKIYEGKIDEVMKRKVEEITEV